MRALVTTMVIAFAGPALADDLELPHFQPTDYTIQGVLAEGALLVQSGQSAFSCVYEEQDTFLLLQRCIPILSEVEAAKLSAEAEARDQQTRLQNLSNEEIDAAISESVREAGCTLDLGSPEFFSNDALVLLAKNFGVEPGLASFLRDPLQSHAMNGLSRMFDAGAINFIDNRSKVALKDCA